MQLLAQVPLTPSSLEEAAGIRAVLEDAAQRFRAAATDLRNLEGPEGEQEAGRDLARSLDQLAGEVDRLVVAIEEGDEDVALEAVREGLAYRDQITAACSDFGAGSE